MSDFVRCTVTTDESGALLFRSRITGELLAVKSGDHFEEVTRLMKGHPPFATLSPCPWCGAEEDRGHIAAKHVDPGLGQTV